MGPRHPVAMFGCLHPTNRCTYTCLYIYIYVYIYLWIRWMDVHIYAYIYVYGSDEWMYIYMYIYIYIYMYICIYLSIRWMDAHIYVYIYIYPSDEWMTGFCIYRYRYTCIYVCVCVYMHVWMHHWTQSSIKSSIHRIHAHTTRTYSNAPHHGQPDLLLPAQFILFSFFPGFGERCNTKQMQHQRGDLKQKRFLYGCSKKNQNTKISVSDVVVCYSITGTRFPYYISLSNNWCVRGNGTLLSEIRPKNGFRNWSSEEWVSKSRISIPQPTPVSQRGATPKRCSIQGGVESQDALF